MTFRCSMCNKVSDPTAPAYRKVLETREKEYPARSQANRLGPGIYTDDPGGKGREIVREALVCESCQ